MVALAGACLLQVDDQRFAALLHAHLSEIKPEPFGIVEMRRQALKISFARLTAAGRNQRRYKNQQCDHDEGGLCFSICHD